MRLSIITINRNNAEGLRKTMESVFAQTNNAFEYIVVDGASTDDSVAVIKEYAQKKETVNWELENFQWISEKDSGIYNAMNKGLRMCHGEYTLMLNSADYLVDEHVVEHIMSELDGTDIIQGNVIAFSDTEQYINRGYGRSEISFLDVMCNNFMHQASFCRKELFDKYGYFDESFRINGDNVFYAKCLGLGNATFRYIDLNVAYYDTTGISADPEKKWVAIRKDEDERYKQLFSQRMWEMYNNDGKKIVLYDKLHSHRWSWYLTMAIARTIDLFAKK